MSTAAQCIFDWLPGCRIDNHALSIMDSIHIRKGTITTQAIPHLETVEINDEPTYITDSRGNIIHSLRSNKSCELHVNFTCITNPENQNLFTVTMDE